MIARFIRWIEILNIRFAYFVIGLATNDHDRKRWRHYVKTGVIREELL